MSNTGRKIVTTLKQYNVTTATYTGLTKPNVPGDPDYIPPVTDTDTCPLPIGFTCPTIALAAAEDFIGYSFSMTPADYANTSINKVLVTLKLAGFTVDSYFTLRSAWTSNNFSHTFTGLVNGNTYTLDIDYLDSIDGPLNSCPANGTVTITAGANCDVITSLTLGTVTSSSAEFTWDPIVGITVFQYRIDGGPWLDVGVATVTVSGLPSGFSGNFTVRAKDGAYGCSQEQTLAFAVEGSAFFRLWNNTSDNSLNAVSPAFFTITAGTIPVAPFSSASGTQSGYTGIVTLTVTGPDLIAARLVVNGTIVELISGVNGTIDFASTIITATDNVDIYIL